MLRMSSVGTSGVGGSRSTVILTSPARDGAAKPTENEEAAASMATCVAVGAGWIWVVSWCCPIC
eukprot:scaffold133401_cov77-Phaeocystis_antarctica.AAC.1